MSLPHELRRMGNFPVVLLTIPEGNVNKEYRWLLATDVVFTLTVIS